MINKVFIRADGDAKIGMGHLVRCLALAQMLREKFSIVFFSLLIQDKFADIIEEQGFIVNKIHDEEDFFTTLKGNEIVVLDHYDLDSFYQKRIKLLGCKLVCIDDLHEKNFFADLIINHAPGISASDYKATTYTQYALGLDYALLRSAFQNCNDKVYTRLKNSIFICFGGSDPENLTERALKVIIDNFTYKSITVVVGESYVEYKNLVEYANRFSHVEIYRGVDEFEIVKLMKTSEIGIVPASGTLLEALACGLQVISGMYVENQRHFYYKYKEADLFIDAGDFTSIKLIEALEEIQLAKKSPHFKISISSQPRILKLFQNLKKEDRIKLKTALREDVEITYKWAQDPNIRSFSFSKNLISFEDHKLWFYNKIESVNCLYLIAEHNQSNVGSIRFDLNNDIAIISYLVDTDFQGNGYGIVLLKKGVELLKKKHPNIREVIGYVLLKNIASIKAFEKLGYDRTIRNEEFIFTKKLITTKL
jgi:UDP-2,4-diacetamido-2,4,6-trideoxy-beta-L-altropyranose hydrolase